MNAGFFNTIAQLAAVAFLLWRGYATGSRLAFFCAGMCAWGAVWAFCTGRRIRRESYEEPAWKRGTTPRNGMTHDGGMAMRPMGSRRRRGGFALPEFLAGVFFTALILGVAGLLPFLGITERMFDRALLAALFVQVALLRLENADLRASLMASVSRLATMERPMPPKTERSET
ncbi:MAG TPA: hypothetical protein VGO11_01110 [Chthoniobacteraceae bacterium]|jgi:hypothetical protein|nr:hypothetical protein [Chthoniobacteraceae bacterium]